MWGGVTRGQFPESFRTCVNSMAAASGKGVECDMSTTVGYRGKAFSVLGF